MISLPFTHVTSMEDVQADLEVISVDGLSNSRDAPRFALAGTGYATHRNVSVNVGLLSATPTLVVQVTMTIKNPAGAFVAVRGGCTAFSTGSAVMHQWVETDALGYGEVAEFAYYQTGTADLWCGDWEFKTGLLTAGSHLFSMACTASSGSVTMDANAQAYITAQELP